MFGWPDPNTGFNQSEYALYTCYFIIHYLVLDSNWCEFQHELIENLIAKAWRCTARWLHAWRLKEALHSSNHHKTTNKWTNPHSYQFVWPDVPSCPRHHAPVRMQCSCCICSVIIHIANIVKKIHRLSHFLKKCIEYLIISCSGSNGVRFQNFPGRMPQDPFNPHSVRRWNHKGPQLKVCPEPPNVPGRLWVLSSVCWFWVFEYQL